MKKDQIDFVQWILSQKWKDSPEWDLQNDLKFSMRDLGFTGSTYKDLSNHMLVMGACTAARETLERVYQLFKTQQLKINTL